MLTAAEVGVIIRRLRLRAGLTQEALAERAGFSPTNLRNYENGRYMPALDAAEALTRALGVPLDMLVGRFPLPADTPPGDGDPRVRAGRLPGGRNRTRKGDAAAQE